MPTAWARRRLPRCFGRPAGDWPDDEGPGDAAPERATPAGVRGGGSRKRSHDSESVQCEELRSNAAHARR